MNITIYHNPRCSKSRQALEIIRESGQEPEIIEYLKTPLDEEAISTLLDRLNMPPQAVLRKSESLYKERQLGTLDFSREALIRIMAQNPVLIERPIVVTDKGARIARPPEVVKDIL